MNYEEALAEARKKGALVVVHFRIEGRPLCTEMDEKVLRAAAVVKASRPFVGVRVDILKRSKLFERLAGGKGALATCVVDGEGEGVSVLAGYADPVALVAFLERARREYPKLKAAREAALSGDPSARLKLADLYVELDCRRQAQACYGEIIRSASGLPAARAHERLARLWVLRGRNRDARRHLEAYRKADPGNRARARGGAMLTEALACSIERRYAEALGLLEAALKSDPDGAEADQMRLTRAMVVHYTGRDRQAIGLLEETIKRHPKSRWAAEARRQIDHIKNPPPEHKH